MELLKRYQTQFNEFCNAVADDMQLAQTLKRVPAEKHFWNTQLVDAKFALIRLEKKRRGAEKEAISIVIENNNSEAEPVILSKVEMDRRVKAILEDLDEKIAEHKLLIEWLELTVKTASFMAHDFKNIIEFKKIEEM